MHMSAYSKSPVFACAPSAYGFKSLFAEIFKPEDFTKVYILKGSCSSGKSTIMSRLASHCDTLGEPYEPFACSFDPSSLDGIILSERKICVVDGTPPHVAEPRYYGAVESVLNTSCGLDCERLEIFRDEIIRLSKIKSTSFGKCYSFLRAAVEIRNSVTDIITDNFDFGKMFSAISRFCDKNIKKGSGFVRRQRLTSVYCKDGLYRTNAFFDRCTKRCLVLDKSGTGHLLLEGIIKEAIKADTPVTVSLSPLDFERVDGLYLPEYSLAFHTLPHCDSRDDYYHVFNMERFVDKNAVRCAKYKLRFMGKCRDSLTDGAVQSLCEAYGAHESLERIYSECTDYSASDALYEKLLKDIFNN